MAKKSNQGDVQQTEEVVEPSIATKEEAPQAPVVNKKKRVWLTIHKDASPGALKEVFVGVNGIGYRIVRGERVLVPVEVVTALKLAVEERFDQTKEGLVKREVPAYPFATEEYSE